MKTVNRILSVFMMIMLIIFEFASSNMHYDSSFFQHLVYAEEILADSGDLAINSGSSAAFDSIDAAAIDFAKEVYAYCEYSRIEFAATLYEYNGKYYYYGTKYGSPHSVLPRSLPSAAYTYIGFIHTHPNSVNFSDNDKNYAAAKNGLALLVTKTYKVLKYDPATDTISTICTSFVPKSLSSSEKSKIAVLLSDTWYSHFENGNCPKGFDCSNMQWPNDSSTRHGNTVYTWTENHYHSYDMHYYEYGFKCTHCNTFVYTEWTPLPCRGGTFCITPWNLRDEPLAA